MNTPQYYIIALLFFSILACQWEAPKKPLNEPTDQVRLTDSLILSLIYDNVEKSKEACCMKSYNKYFSTVTADSSEFTQAHWKELDAHRIEYFVEHIEEITEAGITKFLVVLGGAGSSCHACPGVCAGAVFVREGTGWKLEIYENDMVVMGQTGYPVNEVAVAKVKDGYGIILKNGGIWQGVNWRYFSVVLYKNGVFIEALAEPVVYSSDNWSNAENDIFTKAYAYTSHIWFEPGGGAFDDMVVHFQGTILDKKNQKPVHLNQKMRFEYKNGLFTTDELLPE